VTQFWIQRNKKERNGGMETKMVKINKPKDIKPLSSLNTGSTGGDKKEVIFGNRNLLC